MSDEGRGRSDDWSLFPKFLVRATGFPIERLTAIAGGGVQREREKLFAALGDEAAREALMTSAPLVDRNFDGWRAHMERGRRNAQDKKRERVLWRFLQRLAAKNDSTSFFGGIAVGDFGVDVPEGGVRWSVEASRGPFGQPARQAYSTQWVVEKLLGMAVADLYERGEWPEIERHFRRAPGADERGVVWEPGARGFERTDEPPVVGPEVLPSGLVDPVGAARAVLAQAPAGTRRDGWLAKLEVLERGRQAFAESAGDVGKRREALARVEREAGEVLGEAATRHEGEFYASRMPVHEQADAAGKVIGWPRAWADGMREAAGPFLELSLLSQVVERLAFDGWFAATFGAREVRWVEVLDALGRAGPRMMLMAPPVVGEIKAGLEALRAELRAQVERGETELRGREQVAALMARVDGEAAFGRAFANPDFMMARVAAGWQYLLAESHHLPHLTGCLLPSLVEAEAVVGETNTFLKGLCAPAMAAFPVSWDHSFISVGPDLGAVGLELSGLAREPIERRGTFVDLRVGRRADGALGFRVRSHAGEDLEVAPITRTARVWLASPVWSVATMDLGAWLASGWRPIENMPRLSYEGLVVHRRKFAVKPEDVQGEGVAAVQAAIARRAGVAIEDLPRFMFLRVESEPKPILVDWESEVGSAVALWSLGRGESLSLSEMLPAPEQCWLEGPEGRHTAELRTVMVRTGRSSRRGRGGDQPGAALGE